MLMSNRQTSYDGLDLDVVVHVGRVQSAQRAQRIGIGDRGVIQGIRHGHS